LVKRKPRRTKIAGEMGQSIGPGKSKSRRIRGSGWEKRKIKKGGGKCRQKERQGGGSTTKSQSHKRQEKKPISKDKQLGWGGGIYKKKKGSDFLRDLGGKTLTDRKDETNFP